MHGQDDQASRGVYEISSLRVVVVLAHLFAAPWLQAARAQGERMKQIAQRVPDVRQSPNLQSSLEHLDGEEAWTERAGEPSVLWLREGPDGAHSPLSSMLVLALGRCSSS